MRRRGEMVRLLTITLVLWFASVSSGFALGTISGTVFGPGGGPLTGVDLEVHLFTSSNVCTENQYVQGATVSQSTGTYSLTNIDPGTYYLKTWPADPHYTVEFWAGGSSSSMNCNDAQPVTIAADSIVTASFDIIGAGAINGVVRDSEGTPLVSVPIHVNVHNACPIGPSSHVTGSGTINADGTYTITGIPPGNYYLNAYKNGTTYFEEFWDGGSGDLDCNNVSTLTITAGVTETGTDFYLEQGAEISGNISGLATGEDACVSVFEIDDADTCNHNQFAGGSGVDESGNYSFLVLEGTHIIQVDPKPNCGGANSNDLVMEYWTDDGSNAVFCNQAETFTVAKGDQVTRNVAMDVVAGAISGTVYNDLGQPLVNEPIHVNVQSANGPCDDSIHVAGTGDLNSADGTYTIGGIPPGDYYLTTYNNGTAYLDEKWDGTNSDKDCNNAQLITVTSGQTATGKDFYLEEGAIISGNVAGLANGENACIRAYEVVDADTCNRSMWAGEAGPDSNGDYSLVVPAGEYFLNIDPSCGDNTGNLVAEYWTSDSEGNIDCNQASTFTVIKGDQTTKDINLDIVAGTISGTVYDDGGQPLANLPLHVNVFTGDPCGETFHVTGTGDLNSADGSYSITGIPPGDYYLNTWNNGTVYLPEYWDGTDSDRNCDNAQLITVASEGNETGKDFYLQEGALVSGNVSGLSSGENACITAYEVVDGDTCDTSRWAGGSGPDNSGDYSFPVPAGEFFLMVNPSCGDNSNGLLAEYWTTDGAGTFNCNQADTFTVVAGDQTTKNVTLDIVGGVISGTVYDNSSQPLINVPVHVNVATAEEPCGYHNHVTGTGDLNSSDGTYTITTLPPGDYYLSTWNNGTHYMDEIWDGTNSDTDCANAQLITVSPGDNITGKNFYLDEGAIISGNVSGNYGDDVCISAQTLRNDDPCVFGDYAGGAGPDGNGDYSFVVPPGEYYLEFDPSCGSNPNDIILEFWTSDSVGTLDCAQADTLTLQTEDQATANVVLDEPGAVISGTISGLDGGTVCVHVLSPWSEGSNGCQTNSIVSDATDSNGNYSYVVPPGTYYVDTTPCGIEDTSYFVHEIWTSDGQGTTDCSQGDNFEAVAGPNPSIDFGLDVGGRIAGFVYEDESNTPLTGESDVWVGVYTGDPCSYTGAGVAGDVNFDDGSYSTDNMLAGQVYLKIQNAEYHSNSWWRSGGITDDCSQAGAITVTASQTNSPINFVLPKDSDGDDLSDIDEATYGLDETKKDSDGDGLEDSVEVALFSEYYSIPFGGDLDGDLIRNIDDDDIDGDNASDLQELARGSNPTDAGSVPSALVLYDDFSSPTLDSEKWFAEQYGTEVVGGNLRLFVKSPGDYRQYANLQSINDLKIKTTIMITALNKNVSADGDWLSYRVQSRPYTTGSDPNAVTGRVSSSLYIGDRGNGLEVWYLITRKINETGDSEEVDTGVVIDHNSGLSLNTVYQLEIVYSGVNQFTYSVYDQSGIQIGLPVTATGPALGSLIDNYPHLRVKSPLSGGQIDVTVSKVETGDDSYSIYDDFSNSSLDPAKWREPEVVKEVDNGRAKLLAHTFGNNRSTTNFDFTQYYPYVEAELVVDSTSWQSSARGQSQLAYVSMYNESRGPGSGQSYNGIEGDWEASVMVNRDANATTPYAYTWMARYPGPTWNDYDTLVWEPFDLSISTTTKYKLFIGFAGDFIVSGIENLTTGDIDASIMPGSATQYPPANLFTALRSRIYGGEGEAKHLSYFDNVYVAGDPLFERGDVNVDGNVDLRDAIESIRAMTGSNGSPVWFHGDMNNDGAIGIPEAIGILNNLSNQ